MADGFTKALAADTFRKHQVPGRSSHSGGGGLVHCRMHKVPNALQSG